MFGRIINKCFEVSNVITTLAPMTKRDIEQENEQLRQRIQRECQKLEELSAKEHKKKQLIRSLNQKIYNNYEKYMTL